MKRSSSNRLKLKAGIAIILAFSLLLSFAVIVFAESGIETKGEMAGADGIYEIFSEYLVQDTRRISDEYVGSVQYTVYYDESKGAIVSGYEGTPVIIYSVNHPEIDRIGTDSNETIIASMLDRGYVVIVLDYLESSKAVSPAIEYSAQQFRANVKNGLMLDADIFPEGGYHENFLAPSGYNVLLNQVFFEIDKHSASGTLEKIVENWNSDFKSYKAKKIVKWVRSDGSRKTVADAADGSSPVWGGLSYDENGNEILDTSVTSGEYTYVKYTVAETITDCVNPDGTFIDMNLYMHIVYPTSPSEQVPVTVLASSSGNATSSRDDGSRPHSVGFLYNGYADAVFDFLWMPMARSASFGYYDGTPKDNGSGGITGDHANYALQHYNDKLFNTSALRYLRYVSVSGGDTYKFDLDKFFVYGNSKGGWFNFLGEDVVQRPLVDGSYATSEEKEAAIDKALAALTPSRYFTNKVGETRYQLGEGVIEQDGITLAAGQLQPWLLYESDCTYDTVIKAGDEIVGGAQVTYPSNGSQHEDISEGHTPIILASNMYDDYNAAYGYSNHVANICRELDIPLIHFEVPLGHTLTDGYDLNYNVDTYQAIFDYLAYFLKEEELKVLYAVPLSDSGKVGVDSTVTVKFAGVVTSDEIVKVTVSSNDGTLSGSWSSRFGGTEWTFTPDAMCGETEYTVTVPEGLVGENGASVKSAFTSSFITEFDKATVPTAVKQTEYGAYYTFVAPALTDGGGFVFRFRTENDAANYVSLYEVASTSDTDGIKLGGARVCGVGTYEIDITDYVAENPSRTVTLLLKADSEPSETVVKNEGFDTYDPGKENLTVEVGASIDGESALKVSLENLITEYGVSRYYAKSNSLFSVKDITGGIKTTRENAGRRFLVSIRIYDEISRTVRFSLNRMTNRVDFGTIDYDHIFLTTHTNANGWTEISFVYEMPDSKYGKVSNNRTQQIAIYASTDGALGSPMYFDSLTVTEITTDVEFGYVAIAETDAALYSYKAPINAEMPIAVYNKSELVGEYASWADALEYYQSDYTVRLNSDYTLTNGALSDKLGTFDTVNLDLSGYTLTCANTKNSLLWAKAIGDGDTTVNMYGGTVLLDTTPLVSYEDGAAEASGKRFSINLSRVKFGFVKGAFVTELISSPSATADVNQTVNVRLTDCDFVLRDADRAHDGVVILPAASSDELDVSYEVIGGSFYLDSQKWVSVTDKASSVTFLSDEGEFTALYSSASMFTPFTTPLLTDAGYAVYQRASVDAASNVATYALLTTESCTQYGLIPDEYLGEDMIEKYPFVMFDGDGSFVGAYEKFLGSGGAVDSLRVLHRENAVWDSDAGIHTGVGAVLLLRRDYALSDETFYNWAQIPGEFTIDLGGHEITQYSGKYIFNTESKASSLGGVYFFPTTLNLINGKLVTYDKTFFSVKASESTSSDANSIADKLFTVNAVDVTFALKSGSSLSEMLITEANAANTSYFDEGVRAPYSFSFTDCSFDISARAAGNLTVFDSAVSDNSRIDLTMTVAGCDIIGGSTSGMTVFNEGNSSVTFVGGSDGKYLTLTSTDAYSFDGAFNTDDGYRYLVKVGDSDTVYTLGLSDAATKYGIIPDEYLGEDMVEKYPFVLFFDGVFKGAYTHFANVNSAATESGDNLDVIQQAKNLVTGASGAGKTAYVLLRRGYALDETEYSLDKDGTLTAENFWNYSQIGGTVVVDLGANTLTMGANHLLYAEAKTAYDSAICYENGTIIANSKSLVLFKSTANMTAARSFDVSFSNITFKTAGGAALSIITHESSFKSEYVLDSEIGFTGCTFDCSGITDLDEDFSLLKVSHSKLNATVNIVGGRIICNSSVLEAMSLADDSAAVTMLAQGGDYPTLCMPTGERPDAVAYNTDLGERYFVRSGSTEYSGITYDAYTLREKLAIEFIPRVSITLNAELTLNIYVPSVSRLSQFKVDSQRASLYTEKDGYYLVAVPLSASTAARSVTLECVLDGIGTASYTFSIPKYAEKLLASETSSELEQRLILDVLAYVRSAYTYFGTSDEDAMAKMNSLLADYESEFEPVDGETTSFKVPAGATLVLTSKPAVRFFFETESDRDAYSYSSGGSAVEFSTGETVISGNTLYYSDISLYAYRMIDTVEVFSSGEKVGEFHVNSYLDYVSGDEYAGQDQAVLTDLVEKFYAYCISAFDYRDAAVGNG